MYVIVEVMLSVSPGSRKQCLPLTNGNWVSANSYFLIVRSWGKQLFPTFWESTNGLTLHKGTKKRTFGPVKMVIKPVKSPFWGLKWLWSTKMLTPQPYNREGWQYPTTQITSIFASLKHTKQAVTHYTCSVAPVPGKESLRRVTWADTATEAKLLMNGDWFKCP